jgi:hypothetical protein
MICIERRYTHVIVNEGRVLLSDRLSDQSGHDVIAYCGKILDGREAGLVGIVIDLCR